MHLKVLDSGKPQEVKPVEHENVKVDKIVARPVKGSHLQQMSTKKKNWSNSFEILSNNEDNDLKDGEIQCSRAKISAFQSIIEEALF